MNPYGMSNAGSLMNNMVHHHGGASNSQQLNSSKFKRYSLLDLFDEQYGLLQRNDILDG
jgi:hypothetical protein